MHPIKISKNQFRILEAYGEYVLTRADYKPMGSEGDTVLFSWYESPPCEHLIEAVITSVEENAKADIFTVKVDIKSNREIIHEVKQ